MDTTSSRTASAPADGVYDQNEAIWDRLAHHGAPLSALKPYHAVSTKGSLVEAISDAERSLLRDPEQPAFDRKKDAFLSLLLALQLHFPDVFEHDVLPGLNEDWSRHERSGRIIKLKRICVHYLVEYL